MNTISQNICTSDFRIEVDNRQLNSLQGCPVWIGGVCYIQKNVTFPFNMFYMNWLSKSILLSAKVYESVRWKKSPPLFKRDIFCCEICVNYLARLFLASYLFQAMFTSCREKMSRSSCLLFPSLQKHVTRVILAVIKPLPMIAGAVVRSVCFFVMLLKQSCSHQDSGCTLCLHGTKKTTVRISCNRFCQSRLTIAFGFTFQSKITKATKIKDRYWFQLKKRIWSFNAG